MHRDILHSRSIVARAPPRPLDGLPYPAQSAHIAMPKSFLTLMFDPALEQAVRCLWRVLSEAGACPPADQRHRPHITLVGYELDDIARCIEPLQALCQRHAPMP